MGNDGSKSSMDAVVRRAESKCGKLQLHSRYHVPPKRLEDDYQVSAKVLGSGYSGGVVQAQGKINRSLKFAVKTLKLSNLDEQKRAQLEAEIEVFLVMDHPHVTRLLDVYETPEALQLVMECMEGGELFDRVIERKRFSEQDAADATNQMLLAVNYIHSHGIVHRDIKLENFLYEKPGGSHLKLIDFGFSKIWDPHSKMDVSCGTLSYVAPEVLRKNYTSQCDMWSLGVVVFILLAGYMPFAGKESVQAKNIQDGKYTMKPERWSNVSRPATNFVQSLLQVDPRVRLTARAALEHEWIAKRHHDVDDVNVDLAIVECFQTFRNVSKFRRCCMEMMAWSLTSEERAQVRMYFMKMDKEQTGTITAAELRSVLVDQFHLPDDETQEIFNAMDTNHDHEIHYSDFLAAMLTNRIKLREDMMRAAFSKFDTDNSGYITVENLREVLGETFEGEDVSHLLEEADQLQEGRISYPEFVSYLTENPKDHHLDAAAKVIDKQIMMTGPWDGHGAKPTLRRPRKDEKKAAPSSKSKKKHPCCLM